MEIGNRRGADREPISQINVTPLVDVMLVLLIIFMVTASVGQAGVTVSLPRAKARTLEAPEAMITVTIDKSLQVYIDSSPVASGQLSERLKEIYAHRANKAIFLKADASVAYGDFVKVVSLIKDSGVEQLGMITEAPRR
jgi:biopolymer transport protein TolR